MLDLTKYSVAKPTMNINYKLIPVNKVNIDEFNECVRHFNLLYEEGKIKREFVWTPSGGISINKKTGAFVKNINSYCVRREKNLFELLVIIVEGMFRLQCRVGANEEFNESKCSGTNSFKKLREELAKDGIDIEDYYIENGKEIKETIEKPLIGVTKDTYLNRTFRHCYHIDINSAYPYQMTRLYPEWSKTINRLYDKRKVNKDYKDILNMSYGYFQSKYFGYKLAHISKYCISETIKMLNHMSKVLSEYGCIVIAYNTDGIWYYDEEGLTRDIGQTQLGGFKVDARDCQLRFKSNGSYEYIEDGKYNAVVRGRTNLDDILPRNQWEWGDIYRAIPKLFGQSTTEYGVIECITPDNEEDANIIAKLLNL